MHATLRKQEHIATGKLSQYTAGFLGNQIVKSASHGGKVGHGTANWINGRKFTLVGRYHGFGLEYGCNPGQFY